MPNHIDLNTIDKPGYLYKALSKESFLSQCIDKDVKVVFDVDEIADLIDELLWTGHRLIGTHPLERPPRNKGNEQTQKANSEEEGNKGAQKANSEEERNKEAQKANSEEDSEEVGNKEAQIAKNGVKRACRNTKHMLFRKLVYLLRIPDRYVNLYQVLFSPRYCVGILFNCELLSKFVLFLLIANVATEGGGSNTDWLLMVLFIGQMCTEMGQLWTMRAKYFSEGWNIIDMCSYSLLLVWAILRDTEDEEIGLACLSFAAIPMSLSLLQVFVVVQSIGKLTFLVTGMSEDVLPLLIFTFVIMLGHSVTFLSLFSDNESYDSFGDAMITFFSGLNGGIEYSLNGEGDLLDTLGILSLMLYSVMTSIVLLNLLIAQMSNTYQNIEETSARLCYFAKGGTISRFTVDKESNPLCMLPSPFNLITTSVAIVDWCFFYDKRVSIAGTVADFILEYFIVPIGYTATLLRWSVDKGLPNLWRKTLSSWREGDMDRKTKFEGVDFSVKFKYIFTWIVVVPIIVPVLYCCLIIAHFLFLGFFQPVVNLYHDGYIQFAGVEKEKFGIVQEEEIKSNEDRESIAEFEVQFNRLHDNKGIYNDSKKITDREVSLPYVTDDDIERIMKDIRDLCMIHEGKKSLDHRRKTFEGRLKCQIDETREDLTYLRKDLMQLRGQIDMRLTEMKNELMSTLRQALR